MMRPGTTEYVNEHQLVRKVRGLPGPCDECGTTASRREWANISGQYLGLDDYRPLCVPCHRSFDRRRGHDRRENHGWSPNPSGTRCAVCRARSKAAEYERLMADPARADRRRDLNRAAVRRYRERAAA